MKKILYVLGGLIFLGYLGVTSVVAVKEGEFALINQFGRPVKVVNEAGPTFKLPDPIQSVKRLDKRLQTLSLSAAEYGTRDQRNLVVSAFVVWKITDPLLFSTSVRNQITAQQRIESLVFSEIGAAIGQVPLGDILTVESESEIHNVFTTISQSSSRKTESELGIQILSVKPDYLGFPKQNILAIYKRMESSWEKVANQYRAEGLEEAAKIRAETEQKVRELKAMAYKEGQVLKGESEAQAARLYAEAFEANKDYYQFTRSMETYEKLLDKETRLILSTDSPIFDALFHPPEKR